MARIAGVNIPTNKRVMIALQYIHGIGQKNAKDIMEKVHIPEDRRVSRVTASRDGRALLERSRSRKTAYLAKKLRTLGEGDRAALRRGVEIIERLLEDEP